MTPNAYAPVARDESEVDEKDDLLQNGPPVSNIRCKASLLLLGIALIASFGTNLLLVYKQFIRLDELCDNHPTKYAGLRRNVPTEIVEHRVYDTLNRTLQEEVWNADHMEPWQGFMALNEDYVTTQGLPHAQRWPWDDSKGVYILTAVHELHCVRVLRIFVNEKHDGVAEAELTWHYPHIMHCLDVLRDTVMCNADDTPLYTGLVGDNVLAKQPRAGTGTVKMCRDWNKMLEWSRARSACYKPVHWNDEGYDELERYKYCPDGARPWEHLAATQ